MEHRCGPDSTHPRPPHCPHCAEQLPPEGAEVVGVLPEPVVVLVGLAVVVVVWPPPELLLSLLLMKVRAAWPYSWP
jgi:hypothetical protein